MIARVVSVADLLCWDTCPDLDLREESAKTCYEQVVDTLDAPPEREVLAGEDPTISLRRYEIEHRQQLR